MKQKSGFEFQESDPLKESAIACIFKLSAVISERAKEAQKKRFSPEEFEKADLRFLDLLLTIKYQDVATQQFVSFEEHVSKLMDGYLDEITQKKAKLRFIKLVKSGIQVSFKKFFRRIEDEKRRVEKKKSSIGQIIAKFESDQQGKAVLITGLMEVLNSMERGIEGKKKR